MTSHDIGNYGVVRSELIEVFQKLLSWWHSKSPRDRLFHTLANAQSYEEWEEAAFELDELLSKDLWYETGTSRPHSLPNCDASKYHLTTPAGAKTPSADITITGSSLADLKH